MTSSTPRPSSVSPRRRRRFRSHRNSVGLRLLVCALCGVGSAVVGTLMHRMGAASNIPYGLVLALLLVALSAWASRLRSGVMGVAIHLIVSSIIAWLFAMYGPGGDVLVAVGFGGAVPFFSQHAGYIWLFGVIVVHLLVVFAPHRWVYGRPSHTPVPVPSAGGDRL